MTTDRFRNLIYNPLVQLGLGGLIGGLSGQAPAQAFGGTGNQFMQLGRQLEQQEALKVLSQMPELTTLQKQLLPIAPGEVVKSLLEDKTAVGTRLLTDAEKKQEGFDLTDVVQIDAQGNRKVLKSIPAGEKAKAATSTSFIFNRPKTPVIRTCNRHCRTRRTTLRLAKSPSTIDSYQPCPSSQSDL